jgi:prepilin-type N-terminal cleavage/methylation domain-containing protein
MFTKIQKRMKSQKGFTLIELLVVIIIIAILAAIAIPTFLGQRNKAYDASAKSLVRNAMTALETTYVDSRDFTDATVDILTGIEPSITWTIAAVPADFADDKTVYVNLGADTSAAGTDADMYYVGARSKSGAIFAVGVDKGVDGGVTYTPAPW